MLKKRGNLVRRLAAVSSAGLVHKDRRLDIGDLRAELRVNYGWSGEKINLKLCEL